MSLPFADHAAGLRHVFLRDMVLLARVGVHAAEQRQAQRIRLNIDLVVHEPPAGEPLPDQLSRVVDYEAVAARVRAIVAAGHSRLLETLAERLARVCLEDVRVARVRIRVEKLDVFEDIDAVGIEIERTAAPRT